ncbi:hypothetical protein MMC28_010469 [Mycoblastus sanguinarius]|nr:hypothetical protein [Mycoblastus sanguinarius]
MIWNLQIKTKKKVALCIVLGLALVAQSDPTWAIHEVYLWAGLETFILVVLGSVPTLKPIYDHFNSDKRLRSSYNTKQSHEVGPNSTFFPKTGDASRPSLARGRSHVENSEDKIPLNDIQTRQTFENAAQDEEAAPQHVGGAFDPDYIVICGHNVV